MASQLSCLVSAHFSTFPPLARGCCSPSLLPGRNDEELVPGAGSTLRSIPRVFCALPAVGSSLQPEVVRCAEGCAAPSIPPCFGIPRGFLQPQPATASWGQATPREGSLSSVLPFHCEEPAAPAAEPLEGGGHSSPAPEHHSTPCPGTDPPGTAQANEQGFV